MTDIIKEPTVLSLILDGQKEMGRKMEHWGTATTRLEDRVEELTRRWSEASHDRDECREQVDELLRRNDEAHREFDKRIHTIEKSALGRKNKIAGMSLVWKIALAVLGAVYTVASLGAFIHLWG
jgi:hypothetical protein